MDEPRTLEEKIAWCGDWLKLYSVSDGIGLAELARSLDLVKSNIRIDFWPKKFNTALDYVEGILQVSHASDEAGDVIVRSNDIYWKSAECLAKVLGKELHFNEKCAKGKE